jgi:hypothetical protein
MKETSRKSSSEVGTSKLASAQEKERKECGKCSILVVHCSFF